MAGTADRRIAVPAAPLSLDDLLRATSRSFYLTLRVLPRAVRPQISLAYLLARTSDTIADTQVVSVDRRLDALRRFRARLLTEQDAPLEFTSFVDQQGSTVERMLVERAEEIVARVRTFDACDQQLVHEVLATIISGQELDLQRFSSAAHDAVVALRTDSEFDDYTYRVAGCVGAFWTKLCRAHLFPREPIDDEQFLADGIRFGKGLQMVNILRDVPADLATGRCYLPLERLRPLGLRPETLLDATSEAAFLRLYREYLDVAEQHLNAGWRYTNTLPFGQFRVRLACAWPILIGAATIGMLRTADLNRLRERVKISRGEIRGIMARSVMALPMPFWWRRLYTRAQ